MPRRDIDDDRPRRRPWDDEDDEDRPRRRGRGRRDEGSGAGVLLLVGGIVGLLVLVAVGIGAYFALRSKPKEEPEAEPPVAAAARPDNRRAPQPAPENPDPPAPQPDPDRGKPPAAPGRPARPGVVPVPTINPYINQLVFAGGPDGFVGVVAYKSQGVGQTVDVLRTATGQVLGRVEVPQGTTDAFALSPDGKWLAVMGSAPFEGHPVALHTVADGRAVGRFTPYPKTPATITVPNLVWVAFLRPDLLLTVNEGGGFDTWSVPGFKRAGGIKPTLTAGQRVGVNGFTHSPQNFALTPDGKALAIFNGSGFGFYDPATATETARTEAVTKPGGSANFSGAAFTPDGRRFACFYQTFGAGGERALRVWDAKTGQRVAGGRPQDRAGSPAGFAWWGPRHVLFSQGGISSADIFDTETGQVVGSLRTTVPGKLGTVPPDDKVWGTTGGALFDPETGAAFLVTDHPPKVLGPKTEVELTPDGLRVK